MGFAVLGAAGGLGLFLFGMLTLTDGLKSLAGSWLARALRRFTRTPASGALSGAVTTTLLQSSSATTVAAVGFVGAGLLTFGQALGVIFGANVGSTTTGWVVVALGPRVDLGSVAPLLVLAGVLLRFVGSLRAAAFGRALAGFGLVFLGLDVLQEGMAAFEGRVTPESFPPDTIWGRVRLFGMGLLLTVVLQSSGAGVAAALTAIHAGAITLPQAAALVVGMNVGTTATAALSTIGGSVGARRTGFAHVIFSALTGVAAFLLVPFYVTFAEWWRGGELAADPALALVVFHSGFNLLGVFVILPFTSGFARLVERLVRDDRTPPPWLDRSLLKEPALAVEAAAGALRRWAIDLLRVVAGSLGVRRAGGDGSLLTDEEARAALEFLADLKTGSGDGPLHDRHVALMHLADHLHRMGERTSSRRHDDDPHGDALALRARELGMALLSLAERLEAAAPGAAAAPPGASTEPAVEGSEAARFERLAESLRSFDGELRRDALRDAASGAVDDAVALGRLDESRRLWRIADHVAAIARHLRA